MSLTQNFKVAGTLLMRSKVQKMSHWQQLAVRLTSKAGNWVLSGPLALDMNNQLDSPLRRHNSNAKCAPKRKSKSNNAMKAPQRGYNVPQMMPRHILLILKVNSSVTRTLNGYSSPTPRGSCQVAERPPTTTNQDL